MCCLARIGSDCDSESESLVLQQSEYGSQQDPASNNMPPLLSPTASAFGYPERRAIIVLQRASLVKQFWIMSEPLP
jgi:hypothetical protein